MSNAVIHHEVILGRGVLISTADDSGKVRSVLHPLSSGDDYRGKVVDAFIRLWEGHNPGDPLILYISEPAVRQLLAEQSSQFPGLKIRSVVSGRVLNDVWNSCRTAHNHELPRIRGVKRSAVFKRGRSTELVVATDASKQRNSLTTGIGAVSSTGAVRMDTVRAVNICDGEFAAIVMALRYWGGHAASFDILTDSQAVYQRINGNSLSRQPSSHEANCLMMVDDLRAEGVPVRVHWIRGHNGHELNELADRAAVNARRCREWGQQYLLPEFSARLRVELAEKLAGKTSAELIPAGHCRDHHQAKAELAQVAA